MLRNIIVIIKVTHMIKNYANNGFGKFEESNNYKHGDKEKEEEEGTDLWFVFNKLVPREFL